MNSPLNQGRLPWMSHTGHLLANGIQKGKRMIEDRWSVRLRLAAEHHLLAAHLLGVLIRSTLRNGQNSGTTDSQVKDLKHIQTENI
jgi:hypothetical protein